MENTKTADVICDYADTDYNKNFWQGEVDRSYEDLSEKDIVSKLLPKTGGSVIDLGAGFGRLAIVYKDRFTDVTLLDYANNLLDQARELYKDSKNIQYVQGSCYEIPVADSSVENAVSFRLMHHLNDVPKFFGETARILKPGGKFILEYANKRNALEILRFIFGRSDRGPFDLMPYQYGTKIFYNFHPRFISKLAEAKGFRIKAVYSLSNFRSNILKKIFEAKTLFLFEKLLRRPLGYLYWGPSIVLEMEKK
ncbi:MAG: class I SAM-dependent methyltransferase [Candidatus Margulisiibacteriota bacterium]|jgi:ubiquinone/menaquinone biosynthesis C-methylase UbiE